MDRKINVYIYIKIYVLYYNYVFAGKVVDTYWQVCRKILLVSYVQKSMNS